MTSNYIPVIYVTYSTIFFSNVICNMINKNIYISNEFKKWSLRLTNYMMLYQQSHKEATLLSTHQQFKFVASTFIVNKLGYQKINTINPNEKTIP